MIIMENTLVIRHVLLQLKKAEPSDFKKDGKYLENVPYFVQDHKGGIEPTIYYFSEKTAPDFFKPAFNAGRIYTMVNPSHAVKVCEETIVQWNEPFIDAYTKADLMIEKYAGHTIRDLQLQKEFVFDWRRDWHLMYNFPNRFEIVTNNHN